MRIVHYVVVMCVAVCAVSCHTLPEPESKVSQACQSPAKVGTLARAAKKIQGGRGAYATSVVPLMSSKDALESRLALIDSAQRSLEIQLFIWMEDYTGRLIMERVLMAADRGVKVRVLLDDLILGISYNDRELAAIASHPNVELRLYNPNKLRDRMLPKSLDLVLNTDQRNQRMHNKTIIADGVLAILSGRNIGDHYFGYGDRYNLVDFGAMFSGSIMADIRHGFDRYWDSAPTYDTRAFIRSGRSMPLEKFRNLAREKISHEKVAVDRRIPLARQDWSRWFSAAATRAHGSRADYVEDAPEIPSPSRPVIEEIIRQCERSRKEIMMVTPYLVPDERVMTMLRGVRARGVRVVLLVPTVASNNHLVVHNQYQKYRKTLLRMGVEIYEFKHRPGSSMTHYINEGENHTPKVGLHVKLVVVDSSITYLGSMNFDGRAMFVNTEEGAIIHSKSFAMELRQWVNLLKSRENAWRLDLRKDGRITWLSGRQFRNREPSLDFFQATLEYIVRPLSLRHSIFPDKRVYE